MVNIERLTELRDYIRAHPEEHDQRYWAARWSCGTTMCMAGTAAHLAGYTVDWGTNPCREPEAPEPEPEPVLVASRLTDGRRISGAAADWLGLSDEVQDALFFTMDDDRAKKYLDKLIEDHTYSQHSQCA